jgi:hypothetical protein
MIWFQDTSGIDVGDIAEKKAFRGRCLCPSLSTPVKSNDPLLCRTEKYR